MGKGEDARARGQDEGRLEKPGSRRLARGRVGGKPGRGGKPEGLGEIDRSAIDPEGKGARDKGPRIGEEGRDLGLGPPAQPGEVIPAGSAPSARAEARSAAWIEKVTSTALSPPGRTST